MKTIGKKTFKSLVLELYTNIKMGHVAIAHDITNGATYNRSPENDNLLACVNAIDTSKFALYCSQVLGVKSTTAGKYLRNFRKEDRIRYGSKVS